MTKIEWLAYVITPLTLLAIGWAVALWTRYSVERSRKARGR
ncbi:MAG TPA: hypothetical protein VKA80_08840 [Beijerinckiaceae bacterium]|jgi:hypothetical protein|nr:hypothetical protein [Beijerinckiaceae bacterium]